jgi:uncharacterized membrane protein
MIDEMQEKRSERAPRQASAAGDQQIGRLASLLGGGALALYGLRQRQGGLALALIGSGLIYRGLRPATPADALAAAQRGVVRIEAATTFEVPPSLVFRVLRDPRQLPRVLPAIHEMHQRSDRRAWAATEGQGGSLRIWEVAVFLEKPDELIAWRTVHRRAPIPHAGSARTTALEGGRCELRVIVEFLPQGDAIEAERRRATRWLQGQLDALRDRLELRS